jgi:hypothetical protein
VVSLVASHALQAAVLLSGLIRLDPPDAHPARVRADAGARSVRVCPSRGAVALRYGSPGTS